MRQFIVGSLIFLSLGNLAPADVEAAKIRHLKTLYADANAVGLSRPEGVACDNKSLVVADTGNSRVVIYAKDAQTLTAKAVLPLEGISPVTAQMNSIGDLYLLDGKERSIVKVGANSTLAGKLNPAGVPAPQNVVPRNFRIGAGDDFYLLDVFAERVLVLNAEGQYLRHLPFPQKYGFFSDLAVSLQGTIFLLDSVAGALYAADPGDETFHVINQNLKDYMNFPNNFDIDAEGTFYLSDQYGSGLALVGRDGSFQGHKLSMGWEDGQLYYPAQLCVDDMGGLAIADRNNNRVQVFNLLKE